MPRAVNRFAPGDAQGRSRRSSWPPAAAAVIGDGGNGLAWNRVLIEQCADKHRLLSSIHHYESPNRFATGPRDLRSVLPQDWSRSDRGVQEPASEDLLSPNGTPRSTDWRTGLYCGGLLNAFERCGDVLEIGGPALFLRHVSASGWDNAFVNFDHRTWFPAPNYVVMKLWRDHYAPHRIALEGDAGPLNAVATRPTTARLLLQSGQSNPRNRSPWNWR